MGTRWDPYGLFLLCLFWEILSLGAQREAGAEHEEGNKRQTCWLPLGPPSPRDQFWAKLREAACYVTAVSQRAGMRRTLCSSFCKRTC